MLRGLRASFAFLTRLPVGGFPFDAADLAWAPAYAPAVGLALGAALGGVDYALLPLGNLAAATLVIGLSMLLTGAFHEDGFADTSDALGGGRDRAHISSILKDSRVGTFGAAAVTISIVGRSALLAQLGAASLWALPLAWCAARVGPVWLMAALPYVTRPDQARSALLIRVRWPQASLATGWLLAAALATTLLEWTSAARAGALIGVIIAVAVGTGWRYHRRAGGITGDFLGATEQLGEIGAMAVLAWPS
jgi:adenosylcobinamide-GDP ribazoletransferase